MKKIYTFLLGIFLFLFNPYLSGVFGQCSVNAGTNVAICRGQNTQLTATVIGSGNIIYLWSPTNSLSGSTIYNPIATPTITVS
jgi:hypothetical protein